MRQGAMNGIRGSKSAIDTGAVVSLPAAELEKAVQRIYSFAERARVYVYVFGGDILWASRELAGANFVGTYEVMPGGGCGRKLIREDILETLR